MHAHHRIILLSAIQFAFILSGAAQLDLSKYEVGINIATYIYQGDLTPSAVGSFKTPSLGLGLNVSRLLNNHFSVRFDLSRGALRGDDAAYSNPDWRQQRNFKFRTPLTEASLLLVYAPIGTDHKLSPYVFGGAGYGFVRIRRDYSNYNAEYFTGENIEQGLAIDVAHKLPRAIPVLPVGVGLRYSLSDRWAIKTEAAYRVMSTDYLDGFSQVANADEKDHYHKFSVGLHYSFGKKNNYDCPVVR
jgi:opacity protein-like surface antigen